MVQEFVPGETLQERLRRLTGRVNIWLWLTPFRYT